MTTTAPAPLTLSDLRPGDRVQIVGLGSRFDGQVYIVDRTLQKYASVRPEGGGKGYRVPPANLARVTGDSPTVPPLSTLVPYVAVPREGTVFRFRNATGNHAGAWVVIRVNGDTFSAARLGGSPDGHYVRGISPASVETIDLARITIA